jgi:hypothetical protein
VSASCEPAGNAAFAATSENRDTRVVIWVRDEAMRRASSTACATPARDREGSLPACEAPRGRREALVRASAAHVCETSRCDKCVTDRMERRAAREKSATAIT